MKNTILFIVIIVSFINFKNSFSQSYDGAFYGLFFGRQPSARAESMGRSIASIPGDASSLFYNPAGSASLKGLNAFVSLADQYYEIEDAYYSFFGVSYNFNKYITAALSGDVFMLGEYIRIISNEFGEVTYEKYEPSVATVRLTASTEILNDFYIGVNFNDLMPDQLYKKLSVGNENGVDNEEIVYLDLGIMKSFNFKSMNYKHKITFGSSLTNFNFAGYTYLNGAQRGSLPVIFRIGVSYDLIRKMGAESTLGLLLNFEYTDVFNSQYFGGYNTGLELSVFDLFYIRGGYYFQELRNCNDCLEDLNEFTYGIGVNIPINKWGVRLDYSNLNQPSLTTERDDWKRFEVATFGFYFDL